MNAAVNVEVRRVRAILVRHMLNGAPKVCACGCKHDGVSWSTLAFVGLHEDEDDLLKLRNCACGSTLAVEVPR